MPGTTATDYDDAVRIDGNKYLWEYQDGEWVNNETYLEGWDIILKQEVNGEWVEVNRTTTSGDTGYYSFIVREPGEYRVYEELKEGWIQVWPMDPEYHEVTVTEGDIEDAEEEDVNYSTKFINARDEDPLTPGYWKTHSESGPAGYDDTWDEIGEDGEYTEFFLSDQSYIKVLWTPPRGGNAYYILAHAYIAAELNFLNGAYPPSEVREAFDEATVLFEEYTPEEVGSWRGNQGYRQDFIELAEILDDFNNGQQISTMDNRFQQRTTDFNNGQRSSSRLMRPDAPYLSTKT
ncbi:MAG: hypothetical protein ACOCTK_03790 [Candidatus Saliniplasma sp.]